jgi:hypothetical protein
MLLINSFIILYRFFIGSYYFIRLSVEDNERKQLLLIYWSNYTYFLYTCALYRNILKNNSFNNLLIFVHLIINVSTRTHSTS